MSDKDVKSVGYQKMRAEARRWLLNTDAGQHTVKILRRHAPGENLAKLLDDGGWIDYEDMLKENAGNLVLAANCAEARRGVEMAMQAKGRMGPPTKGQARWGHFASIPLWYVLRRQVEAMDPDYWNDPVNVFRELMKNPEWSTVPEEVIRGELLKYLPKGKEDHSVQDSPVGEPPRMSL